VVPQHFERLQGEYLDSLFTYCGDMWHARRKQNAYKILEKKKKKKGRGPHGKPSVGGKIQLN
jgi:hypothetical protein